MNKRLFLKTLGRGFLAAAFSSMVWRCRQQPAPPPSFSLTVRTPEPPPGPEKNWMWIHPGTRRTADDWKRIFAQMREAGIEAVLPEIFAGKRVLFEHPHPLAKTRKPVLEMMLPLAREVGLEVHAWMWTMLNPNPVFVNRHPEWYVVNGLGESAHDKPAYVPHYQFMCPRRPEVQDFVQGTVEALSQIGELSGIHLDYVRFPEVILAKGLWPKYGIVQDREYPSYDYCYCEVCRSQFREQHGVDPMADLEDPAADEVWRQFRYDGITRLVNDRLAPAARRNGKQITAAVFPNWEYVRQEWHIWRLDGFLPMLYHTFYNEDIEWIGAQTEAAYSRMREANNLKPIYPGLFVPSLKPEEITEAVQAALRKQAKGVSLFSYRAMAESDHWEFARQALAAKNLPAKG
jgi:uncharacterized lipoprotein YddW (UPF0748 family)